MNVLAFVQKKGGTGKTTTATNVSVAATMRGFSVALIDIDPQGSALTWKNARADTHPYVEALIPEELPHWLEEHGSEFDLVVIDTPAHDGDALARVVRLADLAVIVTQPTMLANAVAVHLRDVFIDFGIPFAVLLTQAPSTLTQRLERWIQNHRLLGTVVDAQFAYRMDYQDAVPLGLAVIEYNPHGRAAHEVRQATDWLLNRLEMV
ncbi:MAG TPA: AAA family ATPase [Sphingobium sp.]|uniref:AAA family ATPase n=1 Tax=Sphingobium sp. TaxID=1912891 RepID=UPI002ED02579